MMRLSLMAAVVWLAAALMAGPQAEAGLFTVVGTNTQLDGLGGVLYIPLKPATSGTLGDSLGGGQYVGYQSDSVGATGKGTTSAGSVSFILTYDLTAYLYPVNPNMIVDRASLELLFTFDDLDFKLQALSNWDYIETMELTFLRDPGDTPGPVGLTVNKDNYGYYTGAYGFGNTNNTSVTYTIKLSKNPLEVRAIQITDADFDDIDADKNFAMLVTFRSLLTHTSSGTHGFGNTSESIAKSATFDVQVLPEPTTVAMLVLGGLVLVGGRHLRRRRR